MLRGRLVSGQGHGCPREGTKEDILSAREIEAAQRDILEFISREGKQTTVQTD